VRTAMRVSNSMRGTFKRCPKRFEYAYIQGLRPTATPNALALGGVMHEALAELYDPTEPSMDARIERAFAVYDNAIEREAVTAADSDRFQKESAMGRQMLKFFVEDVMPHDDFKVLATELRVDLRLLNPETGKPTHTRFIGFIDALIERKDTGAVYAREFKTAADLRVDHLILDDQVTDYLWALRQDGIPVVGVMYDILRKVDPYSARSKPPYNYREYIYRSDREIEERGRELMAEVEAIRAMKSRAFYYRNPTRDCVWDCSYRSLCIAELGGGDGSSLIGTTYEVDEDHKGRG